ncbi:MAG: thioredoxin family protein [Candidatus Omnitrophica bacterium]|nr:thioredoxin family protein [Candidatus Omnitrophota bacterium]
MKYGIGFYCLFLLFFSGAVVADAEAEIGESATNKSFPPSAIAKIIPHQYELFARKSDKYKKIKDINSYGKKIDPAVLRVPNRINIIYFYANWCGLCSSIDPKLEKLVKKHKNVCLRKVNISHEQSPVAKQFKVMSVPNVRVYDKEGKLVGASTDDFNQIESYVESLFKQKVLD